MRSVFKRIYFFNLDKLDNFNNERKRIQRLKLIILFFVITVPVIIINDLILAMTGSQPYTFEKYPVLVFWIICLFALYLTKTGRQRIAKFIIIFIPLIFITTYALTGYIIGEHFLWQPIVVLGISIIPYLVLDVHKEKGWILFSFIVFLSYTIFHDNIMKAGSPIGYIMAFDKLNTTPFIYYAVRIIILLFLSTIIFYSVRLNDRQQEINEEINNSLRKASHDLELVNAELQAQRNAINNSASLLIADEKHRILSANNIFLKVSGFSRDELLGVTIAGLLSSYYEPSFYDSIMKTLESDEVWRGELKLKQNDQEGYFWMKTAISNIYNSDQKRHGLLAIMINITPQKNHEERLERLNHEKDRILYAVAHDLKNPLLNFKALLELIKSGAINKNEEEEIFRLMTRDCDHSTNLIAELLEIGRLEDDNFVLTKTPTLLNEFMNKTLEHFDKSVMKKQAKFVTSFDDQVGYVSLNENEFVRVILNLLSNAVKFTSMGGEIWLTTKVLKEDKVSIEISDNGVGISQELLPIIFDKFSKAARAGVQGEKSTGLGMWIVKHIVKLHGGEISVSSEVNQGTTFTIILPQ
jgi:two-component system, OmpR family, sensor histidine kinase VicK